MGSRILARTASVVVLALVAACTGGAPAAPNEATPTAPPSPLATPVVDAATPTPATPTQAPATAQPTPVPATEPAAQPTPADDPYEPGGGGGSVTPSPAAGAATVGISESDELGSYLVGPEGMTLYIFTRDRPATSNCTGTCLDAWPPLTVAMGETPTGGEGVDGTLAVLERDDGTVQVTYNDMPLYYFSGDTAPGDTTGQGVGGYWFVVEP